ncbi:MAG: hypothetical protein ACOY90_22200 [Candidatus Zhuqueibacterota bacterium]
MTSSDLISVGVVVLILGALAVFCGFVIKRYWIDKKPITSGNQFVAEYIYMTFQNKDRKHAMQEVLYQKEDKEEQSDQGEDKDKN